MAPHPRRLGLQILINRNFALLWTGQAISTLGDYVFTTTLVLWIATSIGRGQPWVALAVSGVLIAVAVPELVVGPFAGVFVDRWNKQSTMLRMDALRAVLIALLIPLPAFTGHLPAQASVSAIYAVVIAATVCAQFFLPSRLALIGDIVAEEQHARAFGMAQSTTYLSVILGPPIAAVLFFGVGVQWALLLNALSFAASFISILLVRAPPAATSRVDGVVAGFRHELVEGLRFTAGNRIIRTLVITISIAMLGGGALNALGIFFLTQNLHAAPSFYGLLDGGYGAGALAGSMLAALYTSRLGVARTFWLSVLVLGVLILVYARLTAFWPAFVLLTVLGLPQAGLNVAMAPIFLHVTPRELIGRVSAILTPTVSLTSMVSIGLAGLLDSTVLRGFHTIFLGIHFGPVDTIFTGGGVLLLVAGLYAMVNMRGLVLPSERKERSAEPESAAARA
jgi:MFS family permease